MRRRLRLLGGLALGLAAALGPAAAAQGATPGGDVLIQTLPAVPNARFITHGITFTANAGGVVRIPAAVLGRFNGPNGGPLGVRVPDCGPGKCLPRGGRAQFDRWYGSRGGTRLPTAAFKTWYPFAWSFVDKDGKGVDAKTVNKIVIKSSVGEVKSYVGRDVQRAQMLQAQRVVSRQGGPHVTPIQYRVKSVFISGTNVVTSLQQDFFPAAQAHKALQLIFYQARFTARDALFRTPIGSGIILTFPDGSQQTRAFQGNAEIVLPALPRGKYEVRVDAPGWSFTRPVTLSRNQDVTLQVISYLDLAVVLVLLLSVAITLVVVRRPHLIGLTRREKKPRRRRTLPAGGLARRARALRRPPERTNSPAEDR
ncbi:MAG: hypothetical protein QOK40_1422 [Miltoncostaeaceae bacterium]|nr:hypothetical protein [Miltoncostaeaceae bacterium]